MTMTTENPTYQRCLGPVDNLADVGTAVVENGTVADDIGIVVPEIGKAVAETVVVASMVVVSSTALETAVLQVG